MTKQEQIEKIQEIINDCYEVDSFIAAEGSEGGYIDTEEAAKAIIGEFICDKVDKYTFSHYEAEYRVTHVEQNAMCLNQPELIHYGKGEPLYGLHISDLKIYDKPKELSEFKRPLDMPTCGYSCCGSYETPLCAWLNKNCEKRIITRAPQSWCYVEELN